MENNNVENNNIENKEKEKKQNIKIYISIAIYILVMFLIGSFVIIAFMYIGSKISDIDFKIIRKAISDESLLIKDSKEYNTYYTAYALAQAFIYALLFVAIVLLMKDFLKEDYEKIKKDYVFYLAFIVCSIVGFLIISIVVSTIISKFVEDSENQETIERLILSKGKIPMAIATAICAPVIEELIFRKAIFTICKNQKIYVPYVISVVSFAGIHMISSDFTPFKDWILMSIPYFVCALLFCIIYERGKKNIYASIIVHIANNLIALLALMN